MDYSGKRVLVLGSGVSGIGAASVLRALKANVTVCDTDSLPDLNGFDIAVVSPGIPPDHYVFNELRRLCISIMSDIGLGAELNTAPVTAITGTNGKTTTVEMLGRIYSEAGIRAAVCGNIGVSFAERAYKGGYDRAVLELSSFQLLNASPLKAHIACILNITPDHLDYHGDMRSYSRAKLKISDRQTPDDFLFVPKDLDISGMCGSAEVLREGVDFYADEYITVAGKRIMRTAEVGARGLHNLQNALFAAAAAYADGVNEQVICKALNGFRTGEHRISLVGEYNGTCFYNDSKGTNPGATVAAAECMSGSVALIAGGSDKGIDYSYLFGRLPENVVAVYLTGDNAARMASAAEREGRYAVTVCDTLRECIQLCGRGGYDCVLFSPASASFDRYKNYAERGKFFEREVGFLISGTDR